MLATGEDLDTFKKRLADRRKRATGTGRGRGAVANGASDWRGRQISARFAMDHGRPSVLEIGTVIDGDDMAAANPEQAVQRLLQQLQIRPPVPLNPPSAWLARGLRLYRASCLGIGPNQLDRSSLLLLGAAMARPGSIAQFAAHY